ncbi:EAL domain, c-di-GMP-specific phosphodiesterase class I (or its enzymatically inactive variant) [Sulfurivirga caldicuralii]|uniref:EAL domain, c-di-GMP-specific phosphodiesterase class I (Or its enzymatically inactive variant) n=1 Tax=Sulfurivirga caldicuralii TaxID=364032 RepID=A0A1N6GBZ8_9GAMM|nr:EAL domain-containing protein [Sulfurivirga caldicuralii]SIO05079.1 EAL domain, c-di-GMP-specific phosphodiesterase class I (or its enzymatically inactive variant) [Sulfurivirga caldicuralii]
MLLAEEIIDALMEELAQFRQQHPLSAELQALYDKAPVDRMVRTFLRTFLNPQETLDVASALAEEAIANDLPYALLMGDINALKAALFRYERTHQQDTDLIALFDRIDTAFETTKNAIAWHYLAHLSQNGDVFPKNSRLADRVLIQRYQAWYQQLIHALNTKAVADFEQLAPLSDAFETALSYPESLMVCTDPQSTREIRNLHGNVLRLAALIGQKLLQQAYEQAYLLFEDVKVNVKQLVALLITLYFNYETNRFSQFVKFLESAPTLSDHCYLTIVRHDWLQQLAAAQGEEARDAHLSREEQRVAQLVARHPQHLCYAHGLDNAFYLLSLDLDGEALQQILQAYVEASNEASPPTCIAVQLNALPAVDRLVLKRLLSHPQTFKAATLIARLDSEAALKALLNRIEEDLFKESTLRHFLSNGQVTLCLQPLVNLKTQERTAFEILARVPSEEGLISAELLLPRIHKLGLSAAFDEKVIRQIAEEAEELKKLAQIFFINVLPDSLEDETFLTALHHLTHRVLNDRLVILEINEKDAAANPRHLIELHKRHGFLFAIDDFGAGYASLSTVVDLVDTEAVRFVKISAELTQRMETHPKAERLYRLLVEIAHILELRSISEGVEKQVQLEIVQKAGSDMGQGFLLGLPESIETWVLRQHLKIA